MPASNTDPSYLPVHRLAAEIAARRLSPVDVVEALLARIAAHDAKLHAFIEVYADDARLAAEAADKAIRSGHAVGPLHGVPIALKDLIDLEGRVTTGGSMAWRERRSPATATLARRADRRRDDRPRQDPYGRVRDGRLGHQPASRHAVEPVGPGGRPHPGRVEQRLGRRGRLRRWRHGRSAPIPAARCGCRRRGAALTGLKTTIGRVSTYGILPLAPSLDTPGPMARSVEDAAIALQRHAGRRIRSTRAPWRRRRPADP